MKHISSQPRAFLLLLLGTDAAFGHDPGGTLQLVVLSPLLLGFLTAMVFAVRALRKHGVDAREFRSATLTAAAFFALALLVFLFGAQPLYRAIYWLVNRT